MYEVDGICYAGTPTKLVRVRSARALVGGMLLVEFCSEEKRLFDSTLLTGSAFEPLSDESVLAALTVEHGFISWMDGQIDVAPEFLYENGLLYDEDVDLLLVG